MDKFDKELELTVDQEKSQIGSPTRRKFLGFSLHITRKGIGFRSHSEAKKEFEKKLRQITKRHHGNNIRKIIKRSKKNTTGWINYYGISFMKGYIGQINQ